MADSRKFQELVFAHCKKWLSNIASENIFTKVIDNQSYPRNWKIPPTLSGNCDLIDKTNHDIIIIQQFYIDKNPQRQNEIRNCLSFNVHNKSVTKIILLNERIYTNDELGVSSNKIKQVTISKRLTYKDVFDYVQAYCKNCTIILANSDIFFDASIENVNRLGLHNNRRILCQSRIEYQLEKDLSKCIGMDRPDSQDVWIWNESGSKINDDQLKLLDFNLGKPGCDNAIVFLMDIFSIAPYNLPNTVKCYHYHNVNIRNYTSQDRIDMNYLGLYPSIDNTYNHDTNNPTFIKSIDAQRLSSKISNTECINIARLGNKDAILYVQLTALIKNKGKGEALAFARKNGLNLHNEASLDQWAHYTLNGILSADSIALKHPLELSPQIEQLSISSYYNTLRGKMLFDDNILYWYIGENKGWFLNKDILLVSPYNEFFKKQVVNRFSSKSFSFIDINVQLNSTQLMDDVIRKVHNARQNLETPFVLLCSELYDTSLSAIFKKMNISSMILGEYAFGYFNLISNHPQQEWHKIINITHSDKLVPIQ